MMQLIEELGRYFCYFYNILWVLNEGMDTTGRLSAIFYMGDNFSDFLLVFLGTIHSEMGTILNRKNLIPLGANILSL